MDWATTTARGDKKHLSFGIWCDLYWRFYGITIIISVTIDPSNKSYNALDKYATMYHFVTEMCTYVHISVTKWYIMGYGTGALWDLFNRSIVVIMSVGNNLYMPQCFEET